MDEPTLRRLLAVAGVLAAVAHAVVPRALLSAARWGYATVLRVDFEPTAASTRRVRLLAIPNLLAAVYLWLSADDST